MNCKNILQFLAAKHYFGMNLENILQFLAVYPSKLYLKVKLQLI